MKVRTLGILILFAALSWGCAGNGEQEASVEEKVKTVNVQTYSLQPTTFSSYVDMVGEVQAINDAFLSAEANGNVVKYYVSEGDPVKVGQIIAQIDDSQLKQEFNRLKAVTEQARENFERQKRIWLEDSVGSEIQYLNAKYTYEQNQASLESVKVQLGKTKLRSPFDGVLEEKLVEAGEMVMPGTRMVRILANDYVKVTAGVPSRYADVVQKGDTALVWLNTQDPDTLRGPVTYVGSSIDKQSRTFRIEVPIKNANDNMKIDMLANMRLRTIALTNTIVIGQEYIYQTDEGPVVYVVGSDRDGNKVARQRKISIGPGYGSRVVVEKGLSPEDQFITVGSSFLQEDTRINVVNKRQQAYAN
ncbi:MAG: efflux RND transporter periplasmic adaptor subunit [Bacteroidota bacterium]